jgi:glycosyltransferase involved in cell wall biosynthesis
LIESLNRGCWLAQGKYIARMDADDVASNDRLITQVDVMDVQPEMGALAVLAS